MSYNRKSEQKIIKSEQKSGKSEQLLEYLEKTPINQLRKEGYWIPNWKRSGSKTRKEAFAELLETIAEKGGTWRFLGRQFEI